jgi:hypothetical protein
MLTDIFAHRYLDQSIWSRYTDIEQRLLNQAFAIVKDALPYYTWEGKVHEKNKDKWKLLHDRLARELGVSELSPRFYSYTQKNPLGNEHPVSGWLAWDYACDQFVNAKYTGISNHAKLPAPPRLPRHIPRFLPPGASSPPFPKSAQHLLSRHLP